MPEKPKSQLYRDKTIYGRKACLAFFEQHPRALKRIFFNQATSDLFKSVSRFCAKEKKPYRIVSDDELIKLSKSQHHEGVCMVVRLWPIDQYEDYLKKTQPIRACILALEGIENPHNLGAILRSAAHFGVDAVLMKDAHLLQSGAALRTAEGGGSKVLPLNCKHLPTALGDFKAKFDYKIVTTSSHGGKNLYKHRLPERCIFVLGNEAKGLSKAAIEAGDTQIAIPGTGAVESLNVATATALVLAEYWKAFRG